MCLWHASFRSSGPNSLRTGPDPGRRQPPAQGSRVKHGTRGLPAPPSLPPATRPKAFTIRLLHRIYTRKINVLSPKILPGAVKFPCATHLAPANLSLPHRIARHRTGATASGRLRVGRPGASPVRNLESVRTSADSKGLTTSASAGKRSKRLRRVFG